MQKEYPDAITLVVAQNIKTQMRLKGVTTSCLAKSLGCDRSGLSRMLNGKQKMPISILFDIAHYLAVPMDTLTGLEPPMDSEQLWIPWCHTPEAKLALFAEHEEGAKEFITYDRYPAYSRMTKAIQNKINLSRFGRISHTQNGKAWLRSYEVWGNARLSNYLQRDMESIPKTTTIMRKSDFERLVNRCEPFDICSLEEVAECLDYLKKQCVMERGFRLVLVPDKKLDSRPDLAMQISSVEAIGVIGQNFFFRKNPDTSVVTSEKADTVRDAKRILNRLKALADHGNREQDIVKLLDRYQRRIDKK